jgi:hypothetical protein
MEHRRKIGGNVIIVSVADDLGPLAEDLLDTLAKLDAKGPTLHDGSRIAYGWTLLTLEEGYEQEPTLMVCEPDYFDDPLQSTLPSFTDTARVLFDQGSVCKSLNVEPVASWYTHEVRLAPGVLDEDKVYLLRRAPASDHDTGWYVGPLATRDELKEEELETIKVYELLRRRRDLLHAMALPVGYLAVYFGSIIDAILDPNNKEVFRRRYD